MDRQWLMCFDWSAQTNLRKQDCLNHTMEEHLRQFVLILTFVDAEGKKFVFVFMYGVIRPSAKNRQLHISSLKEF